MSGEGADHTPLPYDPYRLSHVMWSGLRRWFFEAGYDMDDACAEVLP